MIFVVFSIIEQLRTPICESQFDIWLVLFQGYAGFTAIISGVVLLVFQNMLKIQDDYQKKALLLYGSCNGLCLFLSSVGAFIVIVILLTIHVCTKLEIWAVILSVVVMIPSIYLLITCIVRLWRSTRKSETLLSIAKERLYKILKNAIKDDKKSKSQNNAIKQYIDEIDYVKRIIENDIKDRHSSAAREALRWFQEIIVGAIPEYLSVNEV